MPLDRCFRQTTRVALGWLALVSVLLSAASTESNAQATAGAWSADFADGSRDGDIAVMREFNGALYLGGSFMHLGRMSAGGIARWDGVTLEPLPGQPFGHFSAMLVHDGKLVVGGRFSLGIDPALYSVAAFDGEAWTPIREGRTAPVLCLTIHDGELYAGLDQPTTANGCGVARFHDGEWTCFGALTSVGSLASYHDELYAALNPLCPECDRTDRAYLWKWNGTEFEPIGLIAANPFRDTQGIFDLHVAQDLLWIAGAKMTETEMLPGVDVVAWDGVDFQHRLSGSASDDCGSEALCLTDLDGSIVVGGRFFDERHRLHRLAMWRDDSWSLDGSTQIDDECGRVPGLTAVDAYDESLVVAGEFSSLDGAGMPGLAILSGGRWRPLPGPGQGIRPIVGCVMFHQGQLVVGGSFSTYAPYSNNVKMWEGTNWNTLRGGVPIPIRQLFNDGSTLGAAPWAEVARADTPPLWQTSSTDDVRWDEVRGLPANVFLRVAASRPGELFAIAGSAAGPSMLFERRADAWTPLPQIDDAYDIAVNDRHVYLASAGGVYRWNEESWEELGESPSSFELGFVGHRIVASGSADGSGVLWLWTGRRWQLIQPPGTIWAQSFAEYAGHLLACGLFFMDNEVVGLALWDGFRWKRFPDTNGLGAYVLAVHDKTLAVGGDFDRMGAVESENIALWEGADFDVAPLRFVAAFDSSQAPIVAKVTIELPRGWAPRYRLWRGDARQAGEMVSSAVLAGEGSYVLRDTLDAAIGVHYWLEQLLDRGNVWYGGAPLNATETIVENAEAHRGSNGVLVSWTSTEKIGFGALRLLRSTRAGERVEIRHASFAGPGRHELLDADAPNGPVEYWLAEADDPSTEYGPILLQSPSVQVEDLRAVRAGEAITLSWRVTVGSLDALFRVHRFVGAEETIREGQLSGAEEYSLVDVRRVPGTALANQATGEVIYTPPETEARLRELLSNWERFLHEDGELDLLVRMAVTHYQFEAIHPFTDGNGRTGRVLNSLFLVERGLLPMPLLYLSRYIIAHKADYYRLLLGVTRDAEWEPWLLYILRGIEETAGWTTAKIRAIRKLHRATTEHARKKQPKIYSRELIDLIFEQPYCRIPNLVTTGIAARQAASRYLKALASIGVLEERTVGREKLWVHNRLMTLLTRDENEIEPYVD